MGGFFQQEGRDFSTSRHAGFKIQCAYHSYLLLPRGKKRSVLFFGKPFVLVKTGHYEADIQANTQQYVNSLQAEIIKRPGDWTLWMHNRWREYIPIASAT